MFEYTRTGSRKQQDAMHYRQSYLAAAPAMNRHASPFEQLNPFEQILRHASSICILDEHAHNKVYTLCTALPDRSIDERTILINSYMYTSIHIYLLSIDVTHLIDVHSYED